MSYLDRLRALDAKKHVPEQPSKPSKAPFEPFEGGRGKTPFENSSVAPAPVEPARPIVATVHGFKIRRSRPSATGPTDHFCERCGDYAESSYASPNGRLHWFCSECTGRA